MRLRGLGRQARREAEQRAQHVQKGLQGLRQVGAAVALEREAFAGGGMAAQFVDQARLADAGAARQDDALRIAGDRHAQAIAQQAQRRLAADEGAEAAPLHRLEALRRGRAAQHPAHGQRRRAALELHQGRLAAGEEVGVRPERLLAHADVVALGEVRQARGDVRHVAQQLEAAALDVAVRKKDQPGVDAGMQGQRAGREARRRQ